MGNRHRGGVCEISDGMVMGIDRDERVITASAKL
jgi:hypothetical protein